MDILNIYLLIERGEERERERESERGEERERERERERVRNIHVKTDKNKNNYNNCDQSKRKLIKTLLHIQEQGNWYCSLTRSTNQYKKSYSKYTITVYSAVII